MFKFIRKARNNESGSGEVVAVLFMLPLVLWLILSLIDVSIYFQARTSVQNVARDSARQVAIWGGNKSPLNPSSTAIATNAKNTLWNGKKCSPSACSKAPAVTCTPNKTSRAGQQVSCSITYYYKSVAPGNPFTGFSGFLNKKFVIKEVARSETGS